MQENWNYRLAVPDLDAVRGSHFQRHFCCAVTAQVLASLWVKLYLLTNKSFKLYCFTQAYSPKPEKLARAV